ncbi:hypothetical protein E1295_32885 [Nonomuraea mesophila]|uniref:Uncharacterized protein n=1 Tax=Nonomuraea mesophila TaxID=2530382 RepID=A0A4R5EWM2_9ACTN|nr:hypothetical protein [Nonomuraea mesophila]TDE39323.1 hypothetical protein E1295_32885 [Nonomuraea mesophila]
MRSDALAPDALIDEVEPLSHGQRCRRLAAYARDRQFDLPAVVADLRRWHRTTRDPVVLEVSADLPAGPAAELLAATVDWDDPADVLARLAGTPAGGVLAVVETGEALAVSAGDVPAERVLPHARRLAGEGETGALLATALRDQPV